VCGKRGHFDAHFWRLENGTPIPGLFWAKMAAYAKGARQVVDVPRQQENKQRQIQGSFPFAALAGQDDDNEHSVQDDDNER
jgi:hypothetical protein